MIIFDFHLVAHLGQFLGPIWGRKMGEGKTPGVAAQKTRFGVKNGSTMPLVDCPLLCKKWPLIFNKAAKLRIYNDFYIGTKVKRSILGPGKRICAFFDVGRKMSQDSLCLAGKLDYFPTYVINPHCTLVGNLYEQFALPIIFGL